MIGPGIQNAIRWLGKQTGMEYKPGALATGNQYDKSSASKTKKRVRKSKSSSREQNGVIHPGEL